MIKQVLFNNFKNKEGKQKLTGFDLFVGANGMGKSAVIEAIELSMFGSVKDKSSPKEIFKYSSDKDNMSVGVQLELDEHGEYLTPTIERSYKMKEKDEVKSYSQKLKTDLSEDKTIKGQEDDIKRRLGILPVSFDFNTFAGLSNTEKKNYILSFSATRPLFTETEFEKMVKEYIVKGKVMEDDTKSLVEGKVDELLHDVLDGDDVFVLEALDVMLNDAKEAVSYYRKDKDRTLKSYQKLMEKRMTFKVTDTDLKLDEKKLDLLRKKLTNLTVKKNELELMEKSLTVLEQELLKNEENWAMIESSKGEDGEVFKEAIKTLKKNITTIQKQIEEKKILKIFAGKESADIRKLKNDLMEEFYAFKEEGIKLKTTYDADKKLVDQVKSTGGRCVINDSIPCHEDFGLWITKKEGDMVLLDKKISNKRKEYESLLKKVKDCDKDYEESLEKRERLDSDITHLSQELETNYKEQEGLMRKLEKSLLFESVKIEKFNANKEEREILMKKMIALSEKRNTLKDEISDEPEVAIGMIKKDIESLQQTIATKKEVGMISKQIEDGYAEYLMTEKLFSVMSVIQKDVKALKTIMFEKIIKPIGDSISENLHYMDYSSFYVELQDQEFIFGLVHEDGLKVPFEALSTGQQAVLSLCMVIAFIDNSPAKMKVVAFDNIEQIDYDNLAKVFIGLEKIHDRFDNLILSGCITEIPFGDFSYELWNLE